MNRIPQIVKLARCAAVVCLSAAAGAATADNLVKVPGQTKGFLFDQSSIPNNTRQEFSLAVNKEGHFTEYRIESEPPGLICDEACPGTAQRLPAGSITLRIVGKKPVPRVDIPLTGVWSEPCDTTEAETDRCVFNLHGLNAKVSVTVSPNIEPGMMFPLPEGGEGMLVNIDTHDGYVLVANHRALGTNKIWLPFRASWTSKLNINSLTDGRVNTQKLLTFSTLSTTAAAYCNAMNGDWYLPAEKELSLLTTAALKKIPNLDEDSYLWSSTEYSLTKGTRRNTKKPYLELQAKALNNRNATISSRTAYLHEQEASGSWTADPSYTRRYQVLCFRRLPI